MKLCVLVSIAVALTCESARGIHEIVHLTAEEPQFARVWIDQKTSPGTSCVVVGIRKAASERLQTIVLRCFHQKDILLETELRETSYGRDWLAGRIAAADLKRAGDALNVASDKQLRFFAFILRNSLLDTARVVLQKDAPVVVSRTEYQLRVKSFVSKN